MGPAGPGKPSGPEVKHLLGSFPQLQMDDAHTSHNENWHRVGLKMLAPAFLPSVRVNYVKDACVSLWQRHRSQEIS
jgi:hypothetical protein